MPFKEIYMVNLVAKRIKNSDNHLSEFLLFVFKNFTISSDLNSEPSSMHLPQSLQSLLLSRSHLSHSPQSLHFLSNKIQFSFISKSPENYYRNMN